MQITVPDLGETCHDAMTGGWISAFWAVLLLAVLAFSYAATFLPQKEHAMKHEHDADSLPGQRLELAIDGMTCSHCVAAVNPSVARVPRA